MELDPFPHMVIDDYLPQPMAEEMVTMFPNELYSRWNTFSHYNENKFSIENAWPFNPDLSFFIDGINSSGVVLANAFLERGNLLVDPEMKGGGLHQTRNGGFLNIHADFTGHPHHKTWRRRVNLIIFLNEEWKDEWGGHLELWSTDMKRCVKKIAPKFNRAVIFETNLDSYHGHPEPLKCPDGVTRNTIALYYYTEEKDFKVRSTEYKARPIDPPLKRFLILVDKMILRAYDFLKRRRILSDELANKILGFFNK